LALLDQRLLPCSACVSIAITLLLDVDEDSFSSTAQPIAPSHQQACALLLQGALSHPSAAVEALAIQLFEDRFLQACSHFLARPIPFQIKTRFRRASQLRIGPLLLSDPVMMEMRASRLVHGFHDRVVGIAGEGSGLRPEQMRDYCCASAAAAVCVQRSEQAVGHCR
jgi:hypothetical protein